MPAIILVLQKMQEREQLIDEILERIAENEDVLSMRVCSFPSVWMAKIEMANPTVFAVELALSFDELDVSLRD